MRCTVPKFPQGSIEELENRFLHHAPKKDQAQRYERNRAHALTLAARLVDHCPPSRELSLALTKLEEVVFWANAAIARNE
ncbi:hypothetical protein SAMN05444166_4230 [Singulisphaera sp. GP187]|nr:hypothetical protein SAMN05444166_4230 [Singulisphaera sp. GP187]